MSSEMLLAEKYLRVINDRGKRRLPLKRVYRNMRKEGLFLKAYANLYAKKGALTPGSDPEDTIQGMSRKRIANIIQQLEDGSYRWKPARRIYVPKSNGKMRPISIPCWSDKMVQDVMRMILESYYEPRFKDNSHGFRPKRGCLTALSKIRTVWSGVKWFIEGDIKGCFDNISHEKVLELLGQSIHDKRFLKLVKEMLRAGYMEDWRYHQTYSGTPQGGVISPLLANIVLHELDCFVVDELIPQYTKGRKRENNREYNRISDRRYAARDKKDWQRYSALGKELYKIPRGDPNDPNYRRLRYVRYADDFLLGFIGPKSEAEEIKGLLAEFLEGLGLTLSKEKTHVTHASGGRARFLGYDITVSRSDTKRTKFKDGRKQRSVNGTVALLVPRDVVQKYKGRYSRNGKPMHTPIMMNLSDYELVATYGAQLRGLAQYYMLANDVSRRIGEVYWYGMESLRKTLANKHRLNTAQSHLKYKHRSQGSHERTHYRVVVERDGKPPLMAKCGELPLRTHKPSYINDNQNEFEIRWERRSELVARLLKDECELCGAKGNIEVHHVNKVSNIRRKWEGRKAKPKWVEYVIARNRKTVMVCHDCHKQITHGRYDGKKVR
jgi:group II intron reverse transcriptase/maturase